MSPALPKHGMSDIQAEFGLYWDSAKRDNALLIVQVDGAQNFEPNKPFEIRVDGEHYKLPPASSKDFGEVETLRDSVVGAHNKSSKAYIINKDQILKIANGKETAYRVWFLRDKIADGEVSYQYQDYQSYVPHSFRRFHSQVWKQR
jgi:hypothetical protein